MDLVVKKLLSIILSFALLMPILSLLTTPIQAASSVPTCEWTVINEKPTFVMRNFAGIDDGRTYTARFACVGPYCGGWVNRFLNELNNTTWEYFPLSNLPATDPPWICINDATGPCWTGLTGDLNHSVIDVITYYTALNNLGPGVICSGVSILSYGVITLATGGIGGFILGMGGAALEYNQCKPVFDTLFNPGLYKPTIEGSVGLVVVDPVTGQSVYHESCKADIDLTFENIMAFGYAPGPTIAPFSGFCSTPQGPNTGVDTAIGCIPIESTNSTAVSLIKWALGIAGGIAFILIVIAGFMITTSRGDPRRVKAGQELLTSAIAGLLLIIFSVFLLRFIGVNILNIQMQLP